ncbi:MAG: hopanoid biosynthesis associated radical SAM protein HpnH [Planctomycetaceae bacterium]|nr:MAG: hopanoid biosynthesis associated radical SAM protein HpnH [Planctomycetaceae bacterium]
MAVPWSQMATVVKYVLAQRLRGRQRFPLVLMLEPLFRCNLACAGCGKVQYPRDILKRHLTPDECFRAVEECGAPIVSIPGGEPLLHPQITEIVAGLIARRKYVYLCTNALLLSQHLSRFHPSPYLTFSVHLDGLQEEHDAAVCREGVFETAVAAIREALQRGFRVTTNTTIYNTAHVPRLAEFFDFLMDLGVEGMMLSPGYSYEKAPQQQLFLQRQQTQVLFRALWARWKRRWRFNLSPLFLEFLQGAWELECTPWGSPTYNIFGWQRPCYLLQEGSCRTFAELMETTDWSLYGTRSGNPKCAQCMVHCGYEPTAILHTLGSWAGLWRAVRVMIGGPTRLSPLQSTPAAAPVLSHRGSTEARNLEPATLPNDDKVLSLADDASRQLPILTR